MILKALYDYYHRCGDLPSFGLTEKGITFIVVISNEGNFIRIENTLENNRPRNYTVIVGEHTNAPTPLYMYDNLEYTFGFTKEGVSPSENRKHQSFVNQCKRISDKYPEVKAFKAVCLFYEKEETHKVRNSGFWAEMTKNPKANVSFMLQGETEIVAGAKELIQELYSDSESNATTRCLITGKNCIPIKTSRYIKIGSWDRAKLVSFQKDSGYDSFFKEQGENAPISFEADFGCTTALEYLSRFDSRNKFRIGDKRTFLFWTSSDNNSLKIAEESLFNLFGITDDDNIDPNSRIEEVRKTFQSIYSGELPCDSSTRFYILGLAPNKARFAVIYWAEIYLCDFAKSILQHFEDMEIITNNENYSYFGLWKMMSAVTLGGKVSDVQPNLPEMTIKSIFQGYPYPYALYASCIRRIRAEQSESMQIARVAIIKAYLNRTNNNNNKLLTIMLDKENQNPGYVCGRLFAVLEYAQKRANNITTIKERYMNAASNTPASVFATLLNLSVHHVEKLDNEAAKVHIERLKQEIIDMLPSEGFPAHLDLNDQGRFFVGYYQQMQDIYMKKEDRTE